MVVYAPLTLYVIYSTMTDQWRQRRFVDALNKFVEQIQLDPAGAAGRMHAPSFCVFRWQRTARFLTLNAWSQMGKEGVGGC
jgi:hypothetical protein